jgi:hypothetical protein
METPLLRHPRQPPALPRFSRGGGSRARRPGQRRGVRQLDRVRIGRYPVPCHQVCIRPGDAGGAPPGPRPGPPRLPRNVRARRCWMRGERPPDSKRPHAVMPDPHSDGDPSPNVGCRCHSTRTRSALLKICTPSGCSAPGWRPRSKRSFCRACEPVRGPGFCGLGPGHPIVYSARYGELDGDPRAGLAGCGSRAKDSAWVPVLFRGGFTCGLFPWPHAISSRLTTGRQCTVVLRLSRPGRLPVTG